MIDKLTAQVRKVAFDPEAIDNVRASIGDQVQYAWTTWKPGRCRRPVHLHQWQVFRNPNMEDVKSRLAAPVIFDGRTERTGCHARPRVLLQEHRSFNGTPRLMERVLITGPQGFGVLTCATAHRRGVQGRGHGQPHHRRPEKHRPPAGPPPFQLPPARRHEYIDIEGDLDHILHFASPASPIDYLKIPIQTLKVGSLGVHNCLGLAKNKGARVTIASTSEVYGDPEVTSTKSTSVTSTPSVRVACTMQLLFQESITMAYHRYHGLETRIVRIFNTYGPRALERWASTACIHWPSNPR